MWCGALELLEGMYICRYVDVLILRAGIMNFDNRLLWFASIHCIVNGITLVANLSA